MGISSTGMSARNAAQLNDIAQKAFPYRNVINEGVVLSNFERISDWTVSGNGTLTADTTNYKTGSQGGKFTVTTPGSYVGAYTKMKANKINSVSFYAYFPDETPAGTISVRLYHDIAVASYFNYEITLANRAQQGWNLFRIGARYFTTSNGAVWGDITALRIYLTAATGESPEVTIDDLRINSEARPKVILAHSGSSESIYTKAFPMMQQYGFKGTIYVRPSLIGNVGIMTTPQHLELQNFYDWAIGQHGWSGIDYTTATDEEIVEDVTLCKQGLDALGLNSASDHVQRAVTNAHVAEVLSGTFVKTAMAGVSTSIGPQTQPIPPLPSITMWMINQPYTWVPTSTFETNIKPLVDSAIARGAVLIFYTHGIADSPTGYDAATAEYQLFLDYLALMVSQNKLDVVTITEWYDEYTGTVLLDKPFNLVAPSFQEYRGYVTTDISSIAAGAVATFTITVNGALIGDTVLLGPPSAIEAGLTWSAYVSAANTVTVRVHNTTGDAIDPASGTWMARVIS